MRPMLVQPSTPKGQGQYRDPWGAPAGASVPAAQPAGPMASALVPSQPSQQYGSVDPFAVFAAAPAPKPAPATMTPFAPAIQQLKPAPATTIPFAPSIQQPKPAPAPATMVPFAPAIQQLKPAPAIMIPFAPATQQLKPAPATMIPFAPDIQQLVAAPAPPRQSKDDFWADMGFNANAPVVDAPKPKAGPSGGEAEKSSVPSGELFPGGERYDTRIFTPSLGVMFFKPQELTDSLFLQTDRTIVDALEERPVVAFIVEGSSARSAGVELGHVLLKVNGIDIKNPKEASRLIKEGPRPLPLQFYVPDTNVVVAEGEHMVKYDTRETTAPNSAKDWKPKYVVIGGIIAQPWMMNMYRSKKEYDVAVIESQARRPVSVKVKQFSLQGARIQNDWQGPQMVKYKNTLHPWKYIVVLPVARNPIKISAPDLRQLKPVHEGIRRVLLSQQHDRGQHVHTAAPVQGDPYARPQNGHGGDPHEGIRRVLLSHEPDHGRQGHNAAPVQGDPYARPQNVHGSVPHEGIPRVLLSQQRDPGQHVHTAAPVRGDTYARPQNGHLGGHLHSHGGGGGDPYTRGGGAGGDLYARGGGDPYAQRGGGGLL